MTYTLIGTGRMAHFLAARLSAGGHTCVGVWGRTPDAVRAFADRYYFPVLTGLEAATDGPDACLLAVSDAAVAPLASRLQLKTTALAHFSGALPLDALLPAPRRAVLWPVYSITAGMERTHQPLPCAWDASTPEVEAVVAQLGAAINGQLRRTTDADRRQLHLAAVFGNNFVNHLTAICSALCREHQLPFSLLHPLLQQTIGRLGAGSPAQFQTGPAVRGDAATMTAHLDLLHGHPAWAAVYEALSASIAAMHRPE